MRNHKDLQVWDKLSYHLSPWRDLGTLGTARFSRLTSGWEEVMKMLSSPSARVKEVSRPDILEQKAKG
jgi:hypothetical protein